jgi:hypothetical protein
LQEFWAAACTAPSIQTLSDVQKTNVEVIKVSSFFPKISKNYFLRIIMGTTFEQLQGYPQGGPKIKSCSSLA